MQSHPGAFNAAPHQSCSAASARADAGLLRGGEDILPVSNLVPVANPYSAMANAEASQQREDAFTALSIDGSDSHGEAPSCTLLTSQGARSVCAWIAGLAMPVQLLQRWSIPGTLAAAGGPTAQRQNAQPPPAKALQLIVQAALAFQVPALYFRQHIPSWQVYAWYTGLSAGAVVLLAALFGGVMQAHSASLARQAAAPPDAVELQRRQLRATFDADDQMVAVEEARMQKKEQQQEQLAEDNAEPDTIPSVYPSGSLHCSDSDRSDVYQVAAEVADSLPACSGQHAAEGSNLAWSRFAAVCTAFVGFSLCALAFASSILWIQLVAEELVALLDFLGTLVQVDHTLLGFTLLAWGASARLSSQGP